MRSMVLSFPEMHTGTTHTYINLLHKMNFLSPSITDSLSNSSINIHYLLMGQCNFLINYITLSLNRLYKNLLDFLTKISQKLPWDFLVIQYQLPAQVKWNHLDVMRLDVAAYFKSQLTQVNSRLHGYIEDEYLRVTSISLPRILMITSL